MTKRSVVARLRGGAVTRGGKRPGAGAPKGPRSGPRTIQRGVRLSAGEIARWDALCERLGLSQADVVRAALAALERSIPGYPTPSHGTE